VQFDDGRTLSQSNAIILHFAEGSDLVPADAFERAKMLEWMFWEQYSHEPTIAVRRFQKHYLKKSDDAIDTDLLAKGRRALGRMEMALISSDFISGGAALTLADIALLAYTRLSHEGGFDLGDFPRDCVVGCGLHRFPFRVSLFRVIPTAHLYLMLLSACLQ
jgi:glutathione S-transferase